MFNERRVVARVLDCDFHAFGELVDQYERLVFHVVSRLVSQREDCEDLCQDVFVKVHQSLPKFAFGSKLSTWIARIAYLTAVDHAKKTGKSRLAVFPNDLENFHFTTENPAQLVSRKDYQIYLEGLIAQLPEKFRIVITLYHLNEFTLKEIEAITAIPEGTLKSYLYRARKLLKEQLEKQLKINWYDHWE